MVVAVEHHAAVTALGKSIGPGIVSPVATQKDRLHAAVQRSPAQQAHVTASRQVTRQGFDAIARKVHIVEVAAPDGLGLRAAEGNDTGAGHKRAAAQRPVARHQNVVAGCIQRAAAEFDLAGDVHRTSQHVGGPVGIYD